MPVKPKTKKVKKEIVETKEKVTAAVASDVLEIVEEAAKELLAQLQINSSVTVTTGDEGVVNVNVATEESGLLIGYHGETLSSFQLVLGLIVYRKLGQWVKVVVEVGDYRAKRAEQLAAMAESYAASVVASGQPMILPYLPPAERRVVHLALQDREDVESVSEGEGNERRIVIRPKASV